VRTAAVVSMLAFFFSNALIIANHAIAMGEETTVQHKTEVVETVPKESEVQKAKVTTSATPEQPKVKQEEIELLARLVSAEAKGEPYAGQVAVAAVVLNRVEHDHFADSIRDVIYDKGQFQPVRNGAINRKPTDSAVHAAKAALAGSDPTKGALYFANMSIADHHPHPNAKATVKIGAHTFFK